MPLLKTQQIVGGVIRKPILIHNGNNTIVISREGFVFGWVEVVIVTSGHILNQGDLSCIVPSYIQLHMIISSLICRLEEDFQFFIAICFHYSDNNGLHVRVISTVEYLGDYFVLQSIGFDENIGCFVLQVVAFLIVILFQFHMKLLYCFFDRSVW